MEYFEKLEKLFKIIQEEYSQRSFNIVQLPSELGSRNIIYGPSLLLPWFQVYNSSTNVRLLKSVAQKLGISYETRCVEPELILLNPWKLNGGELVAMKGPTLDELREIDALNCRDKNIEPIISMFKDWKQKVGDCKLFKTIEGTIENNIEHNISTLFPNTNLVTKDKKSYNTFDTLCTKKIIGLIFAPSWAVGWKLQKQQEYIEKVVEFYYGIKANFGLDSIEFIMVDGERNEGRLYYYMKGKDMGFYAVPFESAKAKFTLTK